MKGSAAHDLDGVGQTDRLRGGKGGGVGAGDSTAWGVLPGNRRGGGVCLPGTVLPLTVLMGKSSNLLSSNLWLQKQKSLRLWAA